MLSLWGKLTKRSYRMYQVYQSHKKGIAIFMAIAMFFGIPNFPSSFVHADLNSSPHIQSIDPQTLTEENRFHLQIQASDVDHDRLTFSDPTRALPSGASFIDNGDGTADFYWTPESGDAGVYDLVFEVSDGIDTDIEMVSFFVETISSAAANNNFIDWNPGFYMSHSPGSNIKPEICDNDHIQGIRMFMDWGVLEGPEPGDYHFELIDQTLEKLNSGKCKGKNKRLILGTHFMTNRTGKKDPDNELCAPQYLHDEGEVAQYLRGNGKGRWRCLAKVYTPGGRAEKRYKELLKRLALRFGSHPRVEAIGTNGELPTASCKNAREGNAYCPNEKEKFQLNTEFMDVVRRHAPHKLTFTGMGACSRKCEESFYILENYALNTPGISFTWPDTPGENFRLEKKGESTHLTRKACPVLSGNVGLIADNQRAHSQNKDGGPYNFIKAVAIETFPEDGFAYCASHASLNKNDEKRTSPPYSIQTRTDAIASVNGRTYAMGCPTNITNAGYRCVTGRIGDDIPPDPQPEPQPVPDPVPQPEPEPTPGSENRRPSLDPIGDRQIEVGQQLTIFVNATDPDGDNIVYRVNGLRSSWMSLEGNRFTASPKPEHEGVYELTFRASDGSLSVTERVMITVREPEQNNNQAPRLQPVGDRQMYVGQYLTLFVNATDPDGDDITYRVNGLRSEWMHFDGNRFTASPKAEHEGSYVLAFRASDGSLSDLERVTLTVRANDPDNQAPVLHSVGNRQMNVNQHLTVFINASDPNGDAITYSVSGLQPWMSFSGNRFTASPKSGDVGNYTLTFRASDGRLADSETVILSIMR